jgi:hypothetical protein
MQELKEACIHQIREAFKETPPPEDGFGIYSAQAADDYTNPTKEEKRLDRSLTWQDVTMKQMAECSNALSHLNPDGYHHYLPAYMVLSLEHEDDHKYNGFAFMDSAEYSLCPTNNEKLRDYKEARHSRFDIKQVKAIIDYLEYRLAQYTNDLLAAAVAYWTERLWIMEL